MFSRVRIFGVIFICIIALLMAGIVQAQDTIALNFDDDDLEDWEVVDDVSLGDAGPSTWEIRNSQLGLDGNALFQGSNIWGNDGDNVLMGTFILYKGIAVTNFTLDVDVIAADNDGMGLVWAYESTGKHYRMIMCNDGWPSPPFDGISGPFVKFSKRIGDEEPYYDLLEAETGVTYAEGALLHWTLEVVDGFFTITREDGVVVESDDQEYKEGYVGIQLYAQQAEFDNFTITSADAVDPADKMATAWGAIKDRF